MKMLIKILNQMIKKEKDNILLLISLLLVKMNSFDYRKYRKVIIPINERTKKKWDIEESKGFVNGLMFGQIYKIKNLNNGNEKALKYLHHINEYIYMQ